MFAQLKFLTQNLIESVDFTYYSYGLKFQPEGMYEKIMNVLLPQPGSTSSRNPPLKPAKNMERSKNQRLQQRGSLNDSKIQISMANRGVRPVIGRKSELLLCVWTYEQLLKSKKRLRLKDIARQARIIAKDIPNFTACISWVRKFLSRYPDLKALFKKKRQEYRVRNGLKAEQFTPLSSKKDDCKSEFPSQVKTENSIKKEQQDKQKPKPTQPWKQGQRKKQSVRTLNNPHFQSLRPTNQRENK